ncbi:hypothetical protein GGI23_000813 [Coemansia sp. RSA 2559]|nr:hypothetical protein GGI23_000813 [Coemansia sp. RSA 2559]KAJ2868800.1 hypothetical protein GGI22_000631 [Coemansia erecta]
MVSPNTHLSASQSHEYFSPAASSGDRRIHERAMFDDRIHAGQRLAAGLQEYVGSPDTVALSLSRGGAVVGSVVAEHLDIPHFYYMVRPIPCATMPRLSLGSVAGDGSVRVDNLVAKSLGIMCDATAEATTGSTALMQAVEAVDEQLQTEQGSFWRAPPCAGDLQGKTLLVVDDGMEAGDTVREAIMHLRHCYRPCRIVVVVPVCLADLRWQLRRRHGVCVVDIVSPLFVGSIARWYACGVAASEAEQVLLARLFVGPASAIGAFDYD